MTVCEYIDSILKERGMSRRKLAISAGISPSSLQSAFERNKNLSYDMLLPILEVLKIEKYDELTKFGYSPVLLEFEKTLAKTVKPKSTEEMVTEGKKAAQDLAEKIIDNPSALLLFGHFKDLNDEGQEVINNVSEGLTNITKYRKE